MFMAVLRVRALERVRDIMLVPLFVRRVRPGVNDHHNASVEMDLESFRLGRKVSQDTLST